MKVEGYDGNVTLEEVHMSADNPISKNNTEAMQELFGENVIHVDVSVLTICSIVGKLILIFFLGLCFRFHRTSVYWLPKC